PRTGKPLQTGPALVGRVIAGRYRVTGILGEGGMGAVYIAEHLMLGRKVAIKRLHPELTGDEKAVARFQREARAAAATGHEHIVEVLDLGYAEDGAPYLVMEHLRGASLSQVLKQDGRLGVARTANIVGQVLAALGAVCAAASATASATIDAASYGAIGAVTRSSRICPAAMSASEYRMVRQFLLENRWIWSMWRGDVGSST
ncbi:MAG TPA: protein kinase, partial [Kofleriaceae bacterium]|nr:protein kinase [Kofleriaceae bacterium]